MRSPTVITDLAIPAIGVTLLGDLVVPSKADGLVLLAHASDRHRCAHRSVAQQLNDADLATLLFDLLTSDEDLIDHVRGDLRFNIDLLGARLVAALDWAAGEPACAGLPLGCFGTSTGAAAVLQAAARRPQLVRAVVSHGGRPDLLSDLDLARVRVPSMFIVGELDNEVLELNHQAMATMSAPVQLEIVPAAGHLFEEPEALQRMAELASAWFAKYLSGRVPDVHKTGKKSEK